LARTPSAGPGARRRRHIGLLQARAIRQRDLLAEQLQSALNSRVLIEQAKGVIAERRHIDMDQSFALLHGSARARNRRLSDLARSRRGRRIRDRLSTRTSPPHDGA
jgi:ANTAR domain